MSKSEYLSHLGHCEEFTKKMDRLIETRQKEKTKLVFINDGAEWIKNWATKHYPDAVQILDFYHAMEHICDFLECQYEQAEERNNVKQYWGNILKNEGVTELEKHIKKEECTTERQRNAKEKLEKYIGDNRFRMHYDEYQKKNYSIGSGAIESAHKTVIQRRMKLSGQRWSKQGAQHMLDLRTVSMSRHWDWVEQHFRMAA